ncbi:MAG: DM13 domain-containing protein [Sediminibacterium sp.]|nr:DM13 domain-containing protein [Sediminibacterium sp.]
MKRNILYASIFLSIIIIIYSCQKFTLSQDITNGDYIALAKIDSATNVTPNSITLYVSLPDTGKGELLELGLCYSLNGEPTIDSTKFILPKSYFKNTSINVSNLTAGKTYNFRFFILNEVGVAYSSNYVITTQTAYKPPTIRTLDTFNVTDMSASSGMLITSRGNRSILEAGLLWSTLSNPQKNKILNTNLSDTFFATLNLLQPKTNYQIQSYIISSIDTIWGNLVNFTTKATPIIVLGKPRINIQNYSNLSQTSITFNNVLNPVQNVPILEKGLCWINNLQTTPTIANSRLASNSTDTAFSLTINNLTANTNYNFRAYLITSTDTIYSNNIISLTTLPVYSLPQINLDSVRLSSISSANFYSKLISNGNATITEVGFCWSTNMSASKTNGTCSTINNTTSANYSYLASNLSSSTTYYVRSYAINNQGISYSNELNFTTGSGDMVVYSGQFTGSSVSGTASIVRLVNGTYVAKLSNFNCTPGPGLHVFLSSTPQPNAQSIDLGSLKSITGDQTYPIFINSPDFNFFKYISVHCVPYNHFWGAAQFKN